jgi:shikimate kinase
VRKIFLVGLPGSGKSTLGKKLSSFLSLDFVDLDDEIIQSANKTIPEIFQDDGEQAFRDLERKTLEGFTDSKQSFVMATGGGTPCFFDSMTLMNTAGLTIYLEASIQTIIKRVQQSDERPLIKGADPTAKIRSLLEERESYYQQAFMKFHTDGASLEQLAENIKKAAESRFS